MRISIAAIAFSCVLGVVQAAPSFGSRSSTGCSVSDDVIPLPTGQTALSVPAGTKPVFVTIGLGTQNYSCSAAGTFVSIGAVAELFDASCIFSVTKPNASNGSALAITLETIIEVLGSGPVVLGHHFFVNNPTGAPGISPMFDFRSSQVGNPEAFVITAKTGDIPAPLNPTTNIDWLELQAIPGQGQLASAVFRILTLGGQPPASCTPGSDPITVPYAASYWFFK